MRDQRRRRSRSPEEGIAAITVAIMLIPLSILVAFTVDVGSAFAQRQALATSADSAALAVSGKQLAIAQASPGKMCAQLVADDAALPAGSARKSTTIALSEIKANSGFGSTLQSSDISTTLTCTGAASGILQVAVRVDKSVPTTFGRMAGVSSLSINRTAVADLGPPNTVTGYRPMGVCTYQAQGIMADAAADTAAGVAYRSEIIALTKVWTGNKTCDGSGGAGNWGWFDCDNAGVSASTLGVKLASGCSTPLTLDTTKTPPAVSMGGAPGNKGSSTPVHNGMAAIMDTTIELPVYDTYTANGSNATFNVIGFLSLQVCGYDMNVLGTCYDTSNPVGNNEVQVRYAGYESVGSLGSTGAIGQSTGNALVIKLVG